MLDAFEDKWSPIENVPVRPTVVKCLWGEMSYWYPVPGDWDRVGVNPLGKVLGTADTCDAALAQMHAHIGKTPRRTVSTPDGYEATPSGGGGRCGSNRGTLCLERVCQRTR